jgi:hypothetical protein
MMTRTIPGFGLIVPDFLLSDKVVGYVCTKIGDNAHDRAQTVELVNWRISVLC